MSNQIMYQLNPTELQQWWLMGKMPMFRKKNVTWHGQLVNITFYLVFHVQNTLKLDESIYNKEDSH